MLLRKQKSAAAAPVATRRASFSGFLLPSITLGDRRRYTRYPTIPHVLLHMSLGNEKYCRRNRYYASQRQYRIFLPRGSPSAMRIVRFYRVKRFTFQRRLEIHFEWVWTVPFNASACSFFDRGKLADFNLRIVQRSGWKLNAYFLFTMTKQWFLMKWLLMRCK